MIEKVNLNNRICRFKNIILTIVTLSYIGCRNKDIPNDREKISTYSTNDSGGSDSVEVDSHQGKFTDGQEIGQEDESIELPRDNKKSQYPHSNKKKVTVEINGKEIEICPPTIPASLINLAKRGDLNASLLIQEIKDDPLRHYQTIENAYQYYKRLGIDAYEELFQDEDKRNDFEQLAITSSIGLKDQIVFYETMLEKQIDNVNLENIFSSTSRYYRFFDISVKICLKTKKRKEARETITKVFIENISIKNPRSNMELIKTLRKTKSLGILDKKESDLLFMHILLCNIIPEHHSKKLPVNQVISVLENLRQNQGLQVFDKVELENIKNSNELFAKIYEAANDKYSTKSLGEEKKLHDYLYDSLSEYKDYVLLL